MDSFIQGICAKKKLVKFSRLWEECSQEEARIVAREEKMGSEYQALTVHSKKRRTDHHKCKHSNPNKFNKNQPRFRCFTCDERGHYARDCPKNKSDSHKKRETRKDIMLTLQRMMNLQVRDSKKKTPLVMKNMF